MSHFGRIISFLLLTITGFALINRLPFQLQPSRSLPSLRVSFAWAGASPEVIEQQATTPIEGVLATLKSMKAISSSTYPGRGQIQLEFDKEADLDLLRYEAAALIRQIIPRLPEAVTYPQIQANRPSGSENTSLLNYTLNGNESPYTLQKYAEELIAPTLARIPGIGDIRVFGASPWIWELNYSPKLWQSLGLKRQQFTQAITDGFFQAPLDKYTRFQNRSPHYTEFPDFPFYLSDSVQNRLLHLKDVVDIRHVPAPNTAFYRINGLNTININIESARNANQLQVAADIKQRIRELEKQMPPGLSLINSYDATSFLKEELTKIAWRSLLSLGILLLFVWLMSRSVKYLFIILMALIANLGIAALCYYMLGLELHLYSLAGITVSLGLIIDNSIVMTDHLKYQGNKRVFIALLAATLTSIGALIVIFFLDEAQQILLRDFAWVMIVNLAVSLAVAWWLIPALMAKTGFEKQNGKRSFSSLRRIIRGSRFYHRFNQYSIRYRALSIPLIVLVFGLPVFLLPDKWEHGEPYQTVNFTAEDSAQFSFKVKEWYNQSLGNPTYVREVKPWINKLLGGVLRLFIQETYPNARYSEPTRTSLHVNAQMPYGSTIEQMNETFQRIENFLAQFEEIDQYQTSIQSSQQARMIIYFKPAYDKSSFPFFLKSRLESRAIDLGGADWSIYGVGRGFSNAVGMGSKNSRITLYGYNYEQLVAEGEKLKARLLQHPRIKEVFLNGRMRWDYRPHYEYVMELDKAALAKSGSDPAYILDFLQYQSLDRRSIQHVQIKDETESVVLKVKDTETADLWEQLHQSVYLDSSQAVKLSEIAHLSRVAAGDVIDRHNQQYQLLVEYDFIGPYQLQRKVREQMKDETNQALPLGYRAETRGNYRWSREEEKKQYLLIFLVISIIYLICAVLLESLFQPLAVISLIPISFIGTFLTFYLFEFNFDQGGYAAFLLLSGISVNAGLYLINDYNHFRKRFAARNHLANYLKAFHSKIIPIILTILSTLLGLIPFLLGGEDDPFWFSLAVGTMGGLLFSLVAIFIYLPILLNRSPKTDVFP